MGEEKKDMGEVSDGYHTFNELYEHRHALFLALMHECGPDRAWFSEKHHDGTRLDGWFIAGLDIEEGPVTYHLPMRLWNAARHVGRRLEVAPKWDGHTSADVVKRLMHFATGEVQP